jgi:hypothetical protein
MFKLAPNLSFLVLVSLTVLGSDAVGTVPMTFRILGNKEIDDLEAEAANITMTEFLGRVVMGWSDVVDDAGQPVPYSPEALAALINNHPSAPLEIWRQYKQARVESKVKN